MESRQVVGFAFEPEYSKEEIARMDAHRCIGEAESSDATGEDADHAAGRLGNVDWCSCEGCLIMPTVEESLGCRGNEPAVSKMESMQHSSCITLSECFGTLCLDQDVLTLALMTIHDTLRKGPLENNIQNR